MLFCPRPFCSLRDAKLARPTCLTALTVVRLHSLAGCFHCNHTQHDHKLKPITTVLMLALISACTITQAVGLRRDPTTTFLLCKICGLSLQLCFFIRATFVWFSLKQSCEIKLGKKKMLVHFHRTGWLQHNAVLYLRIQTGCFTCTNSQPHLFFVLCDLFISHLNSSCRKDKHIGLLCVSYREENQFFLNI